MLLASSPLTHPPFHAEKFSENNKNNAGYFILARELRDHVVSRNAEGQTQPACKPLSSALGCVTHTDGCA